MEDFLVLVGHHCGVAEGGAVGRNGMQRAEFTAGVLEEIGAGIDRSVAKRGIQAVELDAGLLADNGLGVDCAWCKEAGGCKEGGDAVHTCEKLRTK